MYGSHGTELLFSAIAFALLLGIHIWGTFRADAQWGANGLRKTYTHPFSANRPESPGADVQCADCTSRDGRFVACPVQLFFVPAIPPIPFDDDLPGFVEYKQSRPFLNCAACSSYRCEDCLRSWMESCGWRRHGRYASTMQACRVCAARETLFH
ncbi:hypothetical protein BKA70DRAFT_1228503 [Coprinopsis sp. MPI-PUGE-AT-0042]|nr:hypothetical protein BKA70DRAFT_1228503 [Coprinopsis sp. MPI-PUGE-AT-0042]